MREKILRFEDMKVWQEAQDLAVLVYTLTYKLPDDEKFGLMSQMRRASSSVSANIAEGFGRKSFRDSNNFYRIALGSLLETKNFIYLSGRLDYLEQADIDSAIESINSVHKQITAIMKYLNENA